MAAGITAKAGRHRQGEPVPRPTRPPLDQVRRPPARVFGPPAARPRPRPAGANPQRVPVPEKGQASERWSQDFVDRLFSKSKISNCLGASD